ncbi:MAG: hypothetical protein GX410_01525 [Elusimicrobia bacterium]|nr:hypothetical protein [Elusimicrobiota bacterium]
MRLSKGTALLLSAALWLAIAYSLSLLTDFANNKTLLAIFSGGYLLIFLSAMHLYSGRQSDLLSPPVFFACIFYLYTVSGAAGILQYNQGAYGESFSAVDVSLYLMFCLMGFAAACVGFCTANLFKEPQTAALEHRLDAANMAGKLLLLALPLAVLGWDKHLSASFDFLHAKSYAEAALSSRLEYRAAGDSAGVMQVFFQQVPLTAILALVALLIFNSRYKAAKIVATLILLAHIATVIRIGGRSMLALLAIMGVALYHYKVRNIKFKHFAAVILGGYIMLPLMSVARAAHTPTEMPAQVIATLKESKLAMFSPANNSELVASQTFMRLISAIQTRETQFLGFDGLYRMVAVFVPRTLMPERPLPMSELFTERLYPDIWKQGGGMGFFNLMEGYWIAGASTMLLLAFIYAIGVQYVYRLFLRNSASTVACVWYALFINATVICAIRGGLFTTLKVALISSIPFIAVMAFPNARLFERIGNALGIKNASL